MSNLRICHFCFSKQYLQVLIKITFYFKGLSYEKWFEKSVLKYCWGVNIKWMVAGVTMVNGWQWRDGDSEVAALADCHSISQADGPTLFTSNLQSSHQCFLDQIDISIHNCLCLSVILLMVEALYISQPYLAKFQSVTRPFVHLFDFLMFLLQCLESFTYTVKMSLTQFLQ